MNFWERVLFLLQEYGPSFLRGAGVTMVIALVSEKIVAPRFGIYTGSTEEGKIQLTPEEHKGLRAAGITSLLFLALVLLSFFTGITAGEDGAFIGSPLLSPWCCSCWPRRQAWPLDLLRANSAAPTM